MLTEAPKSEPTVFGMRLTHSRIRRIMLTVARRKLCPRFVATPPIREPRIDANVQTSTSTTPTSNLACGTPPVKRNLTGYDR